MKRRIFSLLTVLFAVLSLTFSVSAESLGSITVTVRYKSKPVKDGKLTAVLVGYADQTNQYSTVFTQDPIDNITSRTTVSKLSNFYTKNKNKHDFFTKTVAIKEGTATFSNLDPGLYLISQKTASTGYYPLNSFLVSIPYWDGTQYQYDVDATVKTELGEKAPKPTEKPDSTSSSGKLPQTGQLIWPIPILTLAGMFLFTLGWWLCFGGGKSKK